ncbi:regulatory protein RecX [Kocuria coralli]|uniref:Regulatory protein RecX n=1 Tax=Kocuria coralli TaxID=1461025 RepID=A0A5J5KW30_9MICC|nr:regulatory protein RecX [Kocuria coralli]KAA9393608.1 regulatory protein RecX [Kocuria coralli]
MSESPYERRRRRAQERYRRSGKAEEPSSDTVAANSDAEAHESARNIVLRQLTASAKSRRQLEDKLADRGVPEDVAASVLDRFQEVGLVDDAAFAETFVRSRAETRKLARPALRRDLQAKGIDPELAEQALEQRTDDDEREDALELVRRKTPSGGQLTQQLADRAAREKLTRRLVSMLARKGYAPGLAFDVVKQVLAEAEAAVGAESDAESDDDEGLWLDTP